MILVWELSWRIRIVRFHLKQEWTKWHSWDYFWFWSEINDVSTGLHGVVIFIIVTVRTLYLATLEVHYKTRMPIKKQFLTDGNEDSIGELRHIGGYFTFWLNWFWIREDQIGKGHSLKAYKVDNETNVKETYSEVVLRTTTDVLWYLPMEKQTHTKCSSGWFQKLKTLWIFRRLFFQQDEAPCNVS